MRVVRATWDFVYDFVVGDDPLLALLVLVVLVVGGVLVALGLPTTTGLCAVLAVCLGSGFTIAMLRDVRSGGTST